MKPIYRFDFNSDTGIVKDAVAITDYRCFSKYYPHDFAYRDLNSKTLKYVDADEFGEFVSGRVYLWEDDKAVALRIIKESLKCRVDRTYSAYIRAVNALNILKEV